MTFLSGIASRFSRPLESYPSLYSLRSLSHILDSTTSVVLFVPRVAGPIAQGPPSRVVAAAAADDARIRKRMGPTTAGEATADARVFRHERVTAVDGSSPSRCVRKTLRFGGGTIVRGRVRGIREPRMMKRQDW